MPKYDNYEPTLPTCSDPILELYSIQHAVAALSEQLNSQEQLGEAYMALLISKALEAVAGKMDNEDWKQANEPPCKVHALG